MLWRKLQKDDLGRCFRTHPEVLDGIPEVKAHRAMCMLMDSVSFAGVAIEERDSSGRLMFIASGTSVFVNNEFALDELRNPRPGLTARILLAELEGQSVILSRNEIANANATTGLCGVTLWARWRFDIRSPQIIENILLELSTSYALLHAGYFFKMVLFESRDTNDYMLLESTGLGKLLESDQPSFQRPRGLAVIDLPSSKTLPTSQVGRHFKQRRPILGLRSSDQELLLAFLDDGPTDAELAGRFGISLSAIKRRWEALYSRVDKSHPALWKDKEPNDAAERKRGERGLEKRRRVLHYVRNHPEELRPFNLQTSECPRESDNLDDFRLTRSAAS
jgi:hypothetical protein